MKFLRVGLLAFCALFSIMGMAEIKPFTLKVAGGENFPEGARVVLYRSKTIESPQDLEFLAKEPFKNGEFEFSGGVTDPHAVVLDVVRADSDYPYMRVIFALEPGETIIKFTGEKYFSLKGGKYSELMVNSWNDNSAYRDAWKALLSFDGDIKNPELRKKYFELNGRVSDLKQQLLADAVKNSKDPMARLLAYEAGYRGASPEQRSQDIMSLCKKLEGTRQAKVSLMSVLAGIEAAKARSAVQIGAVIKDFTARDLSGKEFHLASVLKQNEYVLVEFWASWCGPCRAEIPHMKKAYKHFNKKGFEIVSFTLDDDREAWEDASKEEGIPWIDTGDLLARTSPVVKMYGVSGVPANYLVEGATGKIIAKDLRGKALDDKLAELLSK